MRPGARGSTVGLVDDLLRKPPNPLRDELVKNAMAGVYHDYKGTDATPKIRLVYELVRYGYRDLARRAERGEYDDAPDETDDSMLKAELAADPKLEALWAELQQCKTPEEAMAATSKYLPPDQAVLAALETGLPLPGRKP